VNRLLEAWRVLAREQRLVALAALGLFLSMFLPWYSKTDTFLVHGSLKHADSSLTAWGAFSFVEAAVLLVSAGVLATLFARAERRAFALPGSDGLIVMIAGAWAALLIFYRLLDKPGLKGNQSITATVGVRWGIFIALLMALGLAYAGARMRALERAQGQSSVPRGAGAGDERHAHPLPDASALGHSPEATSVPPAEAGAPPAATAAGAEQSGRPRRPRYPPAPGEQMSIEDAASGEE
jgi:hypothetical protein